MSSAALDGCLGRICEVPRSLVCSSDKHACAGGETVQEGDQGVRARAMGVEGHHTFRPAIRPKLHDVEATSDHCGSLLSVEIKLRKVAVAPAGTAHHDTHDARLRFLAASIVAGCRNA